MRCIDLFSGGGGFSIGFQQAGFDTVGYDHDAEIAKIANANGLPTVVQDLMANPAIEKATVIVGGPPCQPFSEASRMKKDQTFHLDRRNGIDAFVNIVLASRPRAFVMEQSPNLPRRSHAYWDPLRKRLASEYQIVDGIVNMAYFGVPQKRKRYVCVGVERGIDPTGILDPVNRTITPINSVLGRVEVGSGPLIPQKTFGRIMRFESRTGKHARILRLSETARTVTITNTMSKPGSNDCLRFAFDDHGKVVDRKILISENVAFRQRRVTFEEACALQTFPRSYRWSGREKVRYTIVGNAVPPVFARVLAERLRKKLSAHH